MPKAVSNTSPILYLYRIGIIDWLPQLFEEVKTAQAVADELEEGRNRGYHVPNPNDYDWLEILEPKNMPSQWLSANLGAGELQAMALALEYPDHIVILDDSLARRIAKAAGLEVWGSLKILLEGKKQGLVDEIKPLVEGLHSSGLYLSEKIKGRILSG